MGYGYLHDYKLLVQIASDINNQQGTIGLTHGAFDLFHVSHLDLLQKAAKQCDVLFVGVEQDQTVEEYKRKPIFKLEQRVNIVNNVHPVTYAFAIPIIGNDNKLRQEMYEELRIKTFFAGKHFFEEDIVKKRAERAGAKFHSIDTVQTISTTKIIDDILQKYPRGKRTDHKGWGKKSKK